MNLNKLKLSQNVHNMLTIVLQYVYNRIKRSDNMNFYSIRDLRNTPKSIWENLSNDGEVVITNNGKPTAILLDIADGSLEETLKAIKQAKAVIAFNSMREKAAKKGYMNDDEIQKEIDAARGGDKSK